MDTISSLRSADGGLSGGHLWASTGVNERAVRSEDAEELKLRPSAPVLKQAEFMRHFNIEVPFQAIRDKESKPSSQYASARWKCAGTRHYDVLDKIHNNWTKMAMIGRINLYTGRNELS